MLLKLTAVLAILVAARLVTRGEDSAKSHPEPPSHTIRRLEAPGIENLFSVGKRIYSGSSPEGEAALMALQKLGIKTLISVDGAQPDVERAGSHGMRYVHLPFGYDGVPATNVAKLIKAAESLPGPIYVHCHHGQHRGPVAVAIICEGLEGWSPSVALDWLRTAGTATNYAGLYKAIAEFRPPTADQLKQIPTDFPSRTATSPLVETMVKIDERFDAIKAIRKADFKTPPDHSDVSPENEALLLSELFREAHRTGLGKEPGEKFLNELGKAEKAAVELHSSFRDLNAARTVKSLDATESAFQSLTRSCTSCHKTFRD